MGIISRTSFSTGDIPTAAEWNTQFDSIYAEFNGSISAANLAANAVGDSELLSASVTKAKLGVMEYVVCFSYPYSVASTAQNLRQVMFPYAGTLTKIEALSGTTPSPQNIVIDVNNGGVTMLNASALSMTGTGKVSADGANIVNTSILANSILSLDIIGYGTATGGGENLTVNLFIDV